MVPNIGFSLQNQYSLPMEQIIGLLEKAGFSALSPVWTDEETLSRIATCARERGMVLQSLHAPARDIPLLWQEDRKLSADIFDAMVCSIDACARFDIPIVVIHPWQGLSYVFPDTPLNFENFDRLVDHARTLGITIAFENLEGEEYLSALLRRYPDVGFCWDSGHDHCYPHKLDFLKEFGDRLIMTHLNDNLGTRDPDGIACKYDDLHYLPQDGNIDWDVCMRRLGQARKQTTLNFEIKLAARQAQDSRYINIPLEQFIAEAGKRARQVAQRYTAI